MIRFFFRLLATVALAIAVIMAVLDATRSVAVSKIIMTPLGESWQGVSPDTFDASRDFMQNRLLPLLWDPIMVFVMNQPGFIVFAVLALVLYIIGRKPRRRPKRFDAG